MFKKLSMVIAAIAMATAAQAADITGAGATFPAPLYAKWAESYKIKTGNQINYQSVGSGAGIKQIQSKTVTFGATDKPLSKEELDKSGLVQWPQVIGGIVPVINVKGIGPDELVLDGKTLADIYLGRIKTWDDQAIKALTPKIKLPSEPIVVIRRSDGSGTTFNFTHYLSQVSDEWKSSVGEGTAVEWPVGIGAKGNDGVAGNVAQTEGSIGYVEYAYAKQNKISWTRMVNAAGKTVTPGEESFAAAAAGADWKSVPGWGLIITNQKGEGAWPIAAASFILIHAKPEKPGDAAIALDFFNHGFVDGRKEAGDLDYISMPDEVVKAIRSEIWSAVATK